MREPGADVGRPPDDPEGPAVLGSLLVLVVAMAWLLMAGALALVVAAALFLAATLDDWLPGLRAGPALLLVGLSVAGFGVGWLLIQVPNRRTLSISLVAAVALLGLIIALQLSQQGSITAEPDLTFAALLLIASALAVWQAR